MVIEWSESESIPFLFTSGESNLIIAYALTTSKIDMKPSTTKESSTKKRNPKNQDF